MNDVLFTPIRLSELETLIQNSVEKAMRLHPQQMPTNDLPEKLLSIQEAAEFLSLAVPTIYSMVSRKEIPFMKPNKRLYFSRVDLTAYLKEGRHKTHAEQSALADGYLAAKKPRQSGN